MQGWPCVCQRGDLNGHMHYREAPHRCGRCGCPEYRPSFPLHWALDPAPANREAIDLFLGPAYAASPNPPEFGPWWDQFGKKLVGLSREQLALCAFGAGRAKGMTWPN